MAFLRSSLRLPPVPAGETEACPAPVVVISHAFWQREMGGREPGPDERLMVKGERREIVGITPPGFFGVAIGESFDVGGQPFRGESAACSINDRCRTNSAYM